MFPRDVVDAEMEDGKTPMRMMMITMMITTTTTMMMTVDARFGVMMTMMMWAGQQIAVDANTNFIFLDLEL
jgi:hypothetical protein